MLILTDLSNFALCSDGVAKEYRCCELKLLTKIDSAGAGKLIGKNCRDKSGCKDAVNDPLAEDSSLGIFLIKVDGIGVKANLCKCSEICIGEGLLYGCLLSYVEFAECDSFFPPF